MSEIEDALGLNNKPVEKKAKELGDNNAEKFITVFAYLSLVLGCLMSIIYGRILMDDRSTEELGFAVLVSGIVASIASWAFLMVISNISNNIRQIKHELKKRHSA